MAKLSVPNPFTSVNAVKATYGITLPKPHEWRLLPEGIVGCINGIHTMHGTAVATNGIHVAIMQVNTLTIGHMDWFVADEQSESERKQATSTTSKVCKVTIFEEFLT